MNTQVNITENGTTTLATAGKYCDRNIDVNVEVEGDADAAFEAGKKAEYDRFWDAYQNNGGRTNYQNAFYGIGWNDELFKPKHNISLVNTANGMFQNSRITNLKGILESRGLILDTSKMTYCTQFMTGSTITHVPYLDFSKILSAYQAFQGMGSLVSIEGIRSVATVDYSDVFKNTTSLTDLTFDGEIGKNINLGWSPLSAESMESVVGALSNTATGFTVTLSKAAKEAAFTPEEWASLIAAKPNWTITLS